MRGRGTAWGTRGTRSSAVPSRRLPRRLRGWNVALWLLAASTRAASANEAEPQDSVPGRSEAGHPETERSEARRSVAVGQDPFGGGSQHPPPARETSGAQDELTGRDAFDDATVGGVYGRFDGDLSLSVGAGGELGFSPASPRLLGTVALRYYSLIGVYAGYREGLRQEDPFARGLSAGVLLEPLFLLRWSKASTTGSAFWDLTLDSLGLAFGAHADQPAGGDFAASRGFELGVGGGVPLLAWAEGAWIRTQGQLRWFDDGTVRPVVWLTLEWRTFFESGLRGAMGRER